MQEKMPFYQMGNKNHSLSNKETANKDISVYRIE